MLNWRQAVDAIMDVPLDTVDIGDHCWHLDHAGAMKILKAIEYPSLIEARKVLDAASRAREVFASTDRETVDEEGT